MAVERSTNQAIGTAKAAYRLAKAIRIGGKKTMAKKASKSKGSTVYKFNRDKVVKDTGKTTKQIGRSYAGARAAGLRGRDAISAAFSSGAGGGG